MFEGIPVVVPNEDLSFTKFVSNYNFYSSKCPTSNNVLFMNQMVEMKTSIGDDRGWLTPLLLAKIVIMSPIMNRSHGGAAANRRLV